MLTKSCTKALKVPSYLSDVLVNLVTDVMHFYKDNVVRQLFAFSTSFHFILSLNLFCHLNFNASDYLKTYPTIFII